MRSSEQVPAGRAAWLALALALVLCGCWRVPPTLDPSAAVPREPVGADLLELRWKRTIVDRSEEYGSQEFASPAASEDRVFVGSRGGVLYALERASGELLWKAAVGSMSAKPLVDRGRIYVGNDDGYLICIDAQDGGELWRYSTRGSILRTPVVAEDMVFFSNDSDQVYALDQAKGTFRWQYKADVPEEYTLRGHAGVAVSGGLLVTGFANGTVVALRTTTGSVAWMTSIKGGAERFVDVDARPAIVDDTVYTSSAAGGVYALDLTTGVVRWRIDVKNAGSVVVDDGQLFFAAADEGLFAADIRGNIGWRQGTRGGGEPADPLLAGDVVVFSLAADGVYLVDKRTGEVHEYFDPGYGVSATPEWTGDMMYVLSNGGVLYALAFDPPARTAAASLKR
jgi:outer membrane protein assembly factor BamB